MQCTLNIYNSRLCSWTKACLVCWWHLTQRGGGRYIQTIRDEPQRLTGVQQWHSWPISSKITQNNIYSVLMITKSRKLTRSTPWFQPNSAAIEGVSGGSSCSEGPGAPEEVRPPVSGPWDYALLSGISSSVKRVPSLLPNNEDELPPLLIITGEDEAGGRCF